MAVTQIKDGFNGGSDNQLKVNADGIVACPENFEIVEKEPFTEEEISAIETYYDGLTDASNNP